MTAEQTRQLGIEFERRIQQIYPAFTSEQKLDTDTIYSFLNQFQNRYIRTLYLADVQHGTANEYAIYVSDILKFLIKRVTTSVIANTNSTDDITWKATLPTDYFFYIRSNSIESKNYKSATVTSVHAPNKIIKQKEVANVISSFYNTGAILVNPCVVLDNHDSNGPYIEIITDKYTEVQNLDLVYIRCPYKFNVLNYDNTKTETGSVHNNCELPYICFNEIVEGAVELYITENKFRLQMNSNQNNQQQEQSQKQEDDK